MRFLCLYRPGTPEDDSCGPSLEDQAAMGRLIEEMVKAGVLLATEGCLPSKHGFRMSYDDAKYTTTDGPFAETKELISGFCLMQCKTREEAEYWAKRFLATTGKGSSEVRQVYDMPAHS